MTRPAEPLFDRHHESVFANPERVVLRWMAERLPRRIMPDHLTAFGVFGALTVFAGYVASHWSVHWLWLANIGLAIHWFGDSMDGTVARMRNIARPRYGYFVDQNIDVISNLLIAAGIGLSPFVRLDTALLALTGYHMVSIYVFVRNVVERQFHVDVMGLGPTEMRVGILLMNVIVMNFGISEFIIFGQTISWCDVLMLATFALMAVLFIISFNRGVRRFSDEPYSRY